MDSKADTNQSGRIYWVDFSKFIGIILVIAGHHIWTFDTRIIWAFHMPLFFFVSGYCYKKRNTIQEYLWKEMKLQLIPYAITSLIAIIVCGYLRKQFFYISLGFKSATYYDINTMIADTITFRGWSLLWFLPCLYIVEAIGKLIVDACEKTKKITKIIIVVIVGTLGYYSVILSGYRYFFCINIAFFALAFYLSGAWCKSIMLNLRLIHSRYTLIVALALLVVLPAFGAYVDMASCEIHLFPLCMVSAFSGIFVLYSLGIMHKPCIKIQNGGDYALDILCTSN